MQYIEENPEPGRVDPGTEITFKNQKGETKMKTIEREEYLLRYDTDTGEITGLFDRKNSEANWIA